MNFIGPWVFGYFKNEFPDLNFGTTPLPKGTQAGSPTGSWNMALTAQCKNPKAAWEYIKQVTGKEDTKSRTDEVGDLPARKSVLEASTLLNTELYLPIKDQLLNGAKPRPISPVYPKISEAMTKAFNDVAFGKDPAETVKKYADIMQKAIDQK
jgi:fructooligosaccharide transport system substrate-binding protein